MEVRILGVEDTIKEIDTTVNNITFKNFLTQNIQEIWATMKRPSLRILGIEEESQLKGPENIFNKIIEEKIPKENMPVRHKKLTEH